jgi:DNA-binding CsgD family transcriptional regulator
MTGLQALTEKEKETLRLLVDGHDAKSMARHLGLSVHTINERLRDARRKMSASSSREAARQLREIERQDPQFLADRVLGDEAAAADMEGPPTPVGTRRMLRRFGWIAGGIFMSISLALFALASSSGTAPTPASPPATLPTATLSAPAAETAAVQAACQWLALVDRGDWNSSWNATGQAFKSLNTSERWAEVSEAVRTPLGAVVSRELISEENVPAPPYGYQLVKFRTSYANKAGAVETLSLVREGGEWRVVGCTIE